MKQKNIALCIVFSIVTCGIYAFYWFVTLTDELKELSNDNQTSNGVMSLVFFFISCGIYGWYWAYKRGENVDNMKTMRGMESSNSGVLYIILQALGLGLIAYAIMQNEINKVLENSGTPMNNNMNNNMNA